MIFAEPGLEDFLHLALVVPCFQIEDSGLRCETSTILPVEAVGVAEGGQCWFMRKDSGKSEGARPALTENHLTLWAVWLAECKNAQLVLVDFLQNLPI
jgi:hypothetical protein